MILTLFTKNMKGICYYKFRIDPIILRSYSTIKDLTDSEIATKVRALPFSHFYEVFIPSLHYYNPNYNIYTRIGVHYKHACALVSARGGARPKLRRRQSRRKHRIDSENLLRNAVINCLILNKQFLMIPNF